MTIQIDVKDETPVGWGLAQDRARAMLAPLVELLEAQWMYLYVPNIRVYEPTMCLFKVPLVQALAKEDISATSPAAIPIFEGNYSQRGEGLELDAFSRGVVSIAALIEPDAVQELGSLLGMMLERIEADQLFPSIEERFVDNYVEGLEVILLNEEPETRRQLLTFNVGFWWALGHVEGLGDAKIIDSGTPPYDVSVWRFCRDTILERYSRAVMDEY